MSASQALHQTLANIAEICYKHGVRSVVLSPGSRSAPLALAFLRHGGFQDYLIVDERSAAYFALGLAKKDLSPTVLICTSGTAALNYAPAIAEAYFQQLPLMAFTADRPPEWIDQNDNQAIFQENVFGRHVQASFNLSADYHDSSKRLLAEQLVNKAFHKAMAAKMGPVHVNFPFREPFYPDTRTPSPQESLTFLPNPINQASTKISDDVLVQISKAETIWVLAGMSNAQASEYSGFLEEFCVKAGAVCLADPLAGFHIQQQLYHYDDWIDRIDHKPDLVISFGNQFLSKKLKHFFRKNKPNHHIHVQRYPEISDPFQSINQVVECGILPFFQAASEAINHREMGSVNQALQQLDKATKEKVEEALREKNDLEMLAAKALLNRLPENCTLHLGNSTPVRYLLKWNHLLKGKSIRVHANRGTSGIDGSVSTAVGMAQNDNSHHVLILGDLSLMYDRNGLWNNYLPENFSIVVMNNGGGGIFRRIPGPKLQPELESYFTSPQQSHFELLAKMHGFEYSKLVFKSGIEMPEIRLKTNQLLEFQIP